jgi:hypothetical protein
MVLHFFNSPKFLEQLTHCIRVAKTSWLIIYNLLIFLIHNKSHLEYKQGKTLLACCQHLTKSVWRCADNFVLTLAIANIC